MDPLGDQLWSLLLVHTMSETLAACSAPPRYDVMCLASLSHLAGPGSVLIPSLTVHYLCQFSKRDGRVCCYFTSKELDMDRFFAARRMNSSLQGLVLVSDGRSGSAAPLSSSVSGQGPAVKH